MEEVVSLVVMEALSLRHRVERCVVSADGKRMSACLGDFSVRVYEIVDCASDAGAAGQGSPAPLPDSSLYALRLLCSLKGHSSSVWTCYFSQDATLLCSCSSDKTVRLWHLERQEVCFVFTQHSDVAWCCSFVPCRSGFVASGSSDKTVKIWNHDTGEVVHNLSVYDGAVEALSFSKDGTKLCTGSRDGKVVIWTNMFSEVAPVHMILHQTEEWIRFVSFSQYCTNLLITGGNSNAVLVWDLNDVTFADSEACPSKDSENFEGKKAVTFEDLPDKEVLKPKLELLGHLNTVWDSCFAQIRHTDDDVSDLIISCSGDRSIRYKRV